MKKRIEKAIREAISSKTRRIRITFIADSVVGVCALAVFIKAGMVTISNETAVNILQTLADKCFGCDENRKIILTLTNKVDPGLFAYAMGRYVERVAYARPRLDA